MSPAPYPNTTGNEPCAKGDPERFFPEFGGNGHTSQPAKDECRFRCPIVDECLAYGLTHKVGGIWGGKSSDERDAIRKKRGIKAQPISFGNVLPGPKQKVAGEHGTWGMVSRHRSAGEPICDVCKEFTNAKRRERHAKAKAEGQVAS